jgi:ABC-type lipoprotein release transport system permease subunit
VLRAVGFTPGKVAGTVASMALTTAVVALVASVVPVRRAARLRRAAALRPE